MVVCSEIGSADEVQHVVTPGPREGWFISGVFQDTAQANGAVCQPRRALFDAVCCLCRAGEVDGVWLCSCHVVAKEDKGKPKKAKAKSKARRQAKVHLTYCGFRFLLWVPRSHVFFLFFGFLVSRPFFCVALAPVKKELLLYWPASRCANGATVF